MSGTGKIRIFGSSGQTPLPVRHRTRRENLKLHVDIDQLRETQITEVGERAACLIIGSLNEVQEVKITKGSHELSIERGEFASEVIINLAEAPDLLGSLDFIDMLGKLVKLSKRLKVYCGKKEEGLALAGMLRSARALSKIDRSAGRRVLDKQRQDRIPFSRKVYVTLS